MIKKNNKVFKIDEIDVDKILVSKKNPSNTSIKYFTGCNDDDSIRPLCINFPQIIGSG